MNWSFSSAKKPEWPNGEDGNPVPPVFLMHLGGGPLDGELSLNLLEAYGIPHIEKYPNDGLFGKMILGHAPLGMEVYVPETMLEDAHNILNADIIENPENGENTEETV